MTIKILEELFPDCFKLDVFKLNSERHDAMLSIDDKSYILYKDGELTKHGSGLLGSGHPPLEDRFIDDLCLALFQKQSPYDVMRSYHDLSGYPVKDFMMTFRVSKDPRRYHKTNMYAKLMQYYFSRNVTVRAGNKICYVKSKNGCVPLDFFRGELDFHYYKSRLATVAARILFEPAKSLLPFFDGQRTL